MPSLLRISHHSKTYPPQRGTTTEDKTITGHQSVKEKTAEVAGTYNADGGKQNSTAGDDLGGQGEKEAGTTKDHMATDDQQRPGRHADQHGGCEGAGPEQGGVEKLGVCLMRRMAQEETSTSKYC